MGKKVINGSGGGTKGIGLLAAIASIIDRGFNPDVITSVSVTSYFALAVAMRKIKQAQDMMDSFSSDMLTVMFDPAPVTKKGKLSKAAIWNAVMGRPYLGKQRKSLEAVRALISKDEFDAWAADPSTPEVWVLAVDFISGSRIFENLKNHPFDDALNLILASGSIPVYTEAVEMNVTGKRRLMFDGGCRSHIACREILEQYPDSIDEMISVYSRAQDYKDEKPEDWVMADVSTPMLRYLDIAGIENSKSCEWAENFLCPQRGIKLGQVFMPPITKGPYDADQSRLLALKQAAIIEAEKLNIVNGSLESVVVSV